MACAGFPSMCALSFFKSSADAARKTEISILALKSSTAFPILLTVSALWVRIESIKGELIVLMTLVESPAGTRPASRDVEFAHDVTHRVGQQLANQQLAGNELAHYPAGAPRANARRFDMDGIADDQPDRCATP